MKIIGVRLYPLTLRYKKVYEESFGTVGREEKNVLVQIFTDEGITGLGEACTLGPWYSSESQGTTIDLIKNYFAPKVLFGEDPFNIDKIVKMMDNIATGNAIAKAAVDFALHDIMGKALKQPVYRLIGGTYTEKIPLRWAIGGGEPQEVAAMALEGIKKGYKGLKFKCGINPKKDIEIVAAVREAVGDKIDLFVDVNQAYTPEEAIRIIRQMDKYNVLCVEQPVPKHDLEGLKRVRDNVDAYVGACEASYTIWDIMKIINMGAADYINFKVSRSGGFYRGKQIVNMAKVAGISCIGSTQLGTGVELACSAHFAFSNCELGREPYHLQGYTAILKLFDIDSTEDFEDDIVTPTPLVKDNYLFLPTGYGLGVDINPSGLKKFVEGSIVELGDCDKLTI